MHKGGDVGSSASEATISIVQIPRKDQQCQPCLSIYLIIFLLEVIFYIFIFDLVLVNFIVRLIRTIENLLQAF